MTLEAATEFRTLVNNTPALQSAVRELVNEDGLIELEDAIKLGLEHGYVIDEQDIIALSANDNDELSEFELEMVSAGVPIVCQDNGIKA